MCLDERRVSGLRVCKAVVFIVGPHTADQRVIVCAYDNNHLVQKNMSQHNVVIKHTQPVTHYFRWLAGSDEIIHGSKYRLASIFVGGVLCQPG